MFTEKFVYAVSQISWGSVFAGSVAVAGMAAFLGVMGVALGFTVVRPRSDHPFSGLKMTFGWWGFLSIVISMAVGGFLAGLFSGHHGLEHGFMVWALTLTVGTAIAWIAMCHAAEMAAKTVGGAVKMAGSGAGSVLSSMGKGAAWVAGNVVDELRSNIHLDVNGEKLTDKVTSILRDTGIDTLQPEHLKEQMRQARSDLRKTLHQLALKPSQAEEIITGFLQKEKERLDALTCNVDRSAAAESLMKIRGISREEAETMVDNAIDTYEQTVDAARDALSDARSQAEDALGCLKEMAHQTREKADQAASTAAKTAWMAVAALILAALISMGSGVCGVKYSGHWLPHHTGHHCR